MFSLRGQIPKSFLSVLCSSSGHVVGVCQALSIISYERRPLTKESMPLDLMGRSFLTAWMASPTEGEEIDTEENDELAEGT